jgi:hypothetical protein
MPEKPSGEERTVVEKTSHGRQKEPRDSPFWAEPVERLEVTETPDGVSTAGVEGRRTVSPLQGFGQMWQKTYSVRLEGASVSPAGVVGVWRARFREFIPAGSGFHIPKSGIVPGAIVLLGGMTGVRVIYADDTSFTYMTPEGHPFSGWITFSSHEEDGCTVARVQLLIRASDPLFELMMPLGLHAAEDWHWRHTLRSLSACFDVGGKVETRVVCVDPRRQWSNYGDIRHNALLHAAIRPLRRLNPRRRRR